MISRDKLESMVARDGEHFDVIVAGGGPAGLGAALAAAKVGAKTLLLEAKGYLGGVAATSLFMPWNRLLLDGGSRGPVHNALVEKIKSYGKDASLAGKTSWIDGDGLHIHPDFLRLAALETLEDFGCRYVLYSPVSDVKMDGNRVKAVITRYKAEEARYTANVCIDCTGDGDLAYKAGAKYEIGREGDHATMFVTVGFALANVDVEKLMSWFADGEKNRDEFFEILEKAEKDGYSRSLWYSFDRTTLPGVVSVNNGGLKGIGVLNAAKSYDSTLAERGGLQVAHDFVSIARKYKIPGLENCILERVGAALGVRETRRIMGDYVLTQEDAMEDRQFEDIIARRYGLVDNAGLDISEGTDIRNNMVPGYGYPYRGLLVAGFENLLVAGRCGSYTHLGLPAGKSMGNMTELGQAAGVAAALAVKKNKTPRELGYQEVQALLREWGVRL